MSELDDIRKRVKRAAVFGTSKTIIDDLERIATEQEAELAEAQFLLSEDSPYTPDWTNRRDDLVAAIKARQEAKYDNHR